MNYSDSEIAMLMRRGQPDFRLIARQREQAQKTFDKLISDSRRNYFYGNDCQMQVVTP